MTVKMTMDPRTMPDGTILILSVRFMPGLDDSQPNPTIYAHAAIKARHHWYLTGSAPQAAGWPAVEAWLRRTNRELISVQIVTGCQTIWPEPVHVASVVGNQIEEPSERCSCGLTAFAAPELHRDDCLPVDTSQATE